MDKGELSLAAIFFGVGGVVCLLSLTMPIGSLRMAGPGFFPFWLGVVLMALAALLFAQVWLRGRAAGRPAQTQPPLAGGQPAAPAEPLASGQMLLFLGVLVASALLLGVLGYFLTTLLVMLSLLYVLGSRRWLLNLTLSLVTAAVTYLMFVIWLKIPLPAGFWAR
ncbi:MAG: tripartite tricarboxylate transporter TctB family protein [Thermodesulfobacteriota bacterium]